MDWVIIKERRLKMHDETAVQSVMEVVDDELRDLAALPYVETLTEIRSRVDEMIKECKQHGWG